MNNLSFLKTFVCICRFKNDNCCPTFNETYISSREWEQKKTSLLIFCAGVMYRYISFVLFAISLRSVFLCKRHLTSSYAAVASG